VPCPFKQLLRNPKLEWKMRRSATEIDTAFVAPIGIDERYPRHSRNSTGEVAGLKRASSHSSND
jgi:hypothetical protein